MKKLYVLAFPVLFSLSVSAQQSDCRTPVVSYEEGPHAEWHEDSLQVRFTVRVAGRLCGPTSLHIVPAYISGGDTIRYRTLSYFKPRTIVISAGSSSSGRHGTIAWYIW